MTDKDVNDGEPNPKRCFDDIAHHEHHYPVDVSRYTRGQKPTPLIALGEAAYPPDDKLAMFRTRSGSGIGVDMMDY